MRIRIRIRMRMRTRMRMRIKVRVECELRELCGIVGVVGNVGIGHVPCRIPLRETRHRRRERRRPLFYPFSLRRWFRKVSSCMTVSVDQEQ